MQKIFIKIKTISEIIYGIKHYDERFEMIFLMKLKKIWKSKMFSFQKKNLFMYYLQDNVDHHDSIESLEDQDFINNINQNYHRVFEMKLKLERKTEMIQEL
jgi:hypothetical protein